MAVVKHPNVAGSFYPSNPQVLKTMLEEYIQPPINLEDNDLGQLRALIVPHAGYVYSGPVAGVAYYKLSLLADKFKSIAILSPSHYFNFNSVAVLNCDEYETPLGSLHIDSVTINELLHKNLVDDLPRVFDREHALEVHLPFIKKIAPDVQIIPLIVGQAGTEQVQPVIQELIDRNIFIIISSDLSHFHSYETAQKIDRETQKLIETLDYKQLRGDNACGVYPLAGLVKWAKENGGIIRTLDLRNSGDTAGDRFRVVGYGSFALYSE